MHSRSNVSYTVMIAASFLVAVVVAAPQQIALGQPVEEAPVEKMPIVKGQLTVWQPIQISFIGPEATTTDTSPNPFLDIRLQVVFQGPSGQEFVVPGFFDGDGKGGSHGPIWRVRFAANEPGTWQYRALFRAGPGVAIDTAPTAGKPLKLFAGTGSLRVAPRDPEAPGFLKWGRLGYVSKHYLKFSDGPYWIRGGVDSPENFLAYAGFVRTPPKHKYADHVSDWRAGDPDWDNGKGRGIIGALNYLASQHVNSIYFLTMNIGGDGRDVWPWTSPIDPKGNPSNDNYHFDIGKLRQWEVVFAHAERLGIALHVVLNEAEEANKRELDNGELGPERKLYYREMIARFGHHLALQWNLCEEYNIAFDYGPDRLRCFAETIRALDPYDHPITVHSAGDPVEVLRFTYGDARFDLTSIQCNQQPIHEVTEAIYRATEKAGRPLPVSLDEFTVDRGQRASFLPVDHAAGHRREKIWPTYFSGGMIEFILQDLLAVESFKKPELEKLWRYVWIARHFMEEHLPYWEMEPADELAQGGDSLPVGIGNGRSLPMGAQVFAKRGEVYTVYLPICSSTGTLDLTDLNSQAKQRWFNPRTGKFAGNSKIVKGGKRLELGPPPSMPDLDWVVLIERKENLSHSEKQFPGNHWETDSPESVGLDPDKLDTFAEELGGDGCIVRDGIMVKTWGHYNANADWASAAKPLLSTLLLLAVQEGRLESVDGLVKDIGWPLSEKDASMTFRHLANMVSGYACGEAPGAAWGYNDFAIQLYARSLEKVYEQPLNQAFTQRLAALDFEDGKLFGSRNGAGVTASPRDFARLGLLWLNRGKWKGKQVLPAPLIQEFLRSGVPANLPRTSTPGTDYLGIGSYGGGTNQTAYGPGGYGFNLWFNSRQATGELAWPDLPEDAYQANGMWNRDTVTVIPSLRMVVAVRGAKKSSFEPGNPTNKFNQMMSLLLQANTERTSATEISQQQLQKRIVDRVAPHPRLLVDGDDLAAIRQVIQIDPLRRSVADAVIHHATLLRDVEPVIRTLTGKRLLAQSRLCVQRVLTLAMAYHLTGDRQHARRCQQEMLAAARFRDWNPSHFLDVAEMTFALAIGYDWLHNELDNAARREIRDAIVQKGVLLPLETHHKDWVQSHNNWGQVCHAGMVAGALAVMEDEPELAARTIQNALQNVPLAMAAYAPRGAYPEGPDYWGYGTSYNVLLLSSLESALGTDFGLSHTPGFRQTGQFLSLACGPSGLFFNYSDGDDRRTLQPALFWLASHFHRPDWLLGEYHRLQQQVEAIQRTNSFSKGNRFFPLVLLWMMPKPDRLEIRMPLNWSGGGITPIAVHRSAWNDPTATYVGIKAGSPLTNHGHMDIGSFVLDADGQRWAFDLGAEDYQGIESRGMNLWNRSQDSDRWSIFRLSNKSHNTLVIDGQLQRAKGHGKVVNFSADSAIPHTVVDMSSLYQEQCESVLRGIALLPSREVLIRDEMTGLKPGSRVRWGMITRGTAGALGQSTIELRQSDARMTLSLLGPTHAIWTDIDTAAPRNLWDSPNPGTHMLAFEVLVPLTGKLSFTVLATPGSCHKSSRDHWVDKRLRDW